MPELPAVIPKIVDEVLVDAGILPPREQFSQSLEISGVTIDMLAQILADLLMNGKESTRLKALQLALAAKGINIQPAFENSPAGITVNINVGNNNLNALFAPERS
jgi:hypothetical protein